MRLGTQLKPKLFVYSYMAIRTKPKTRVAGSTRSNHVKVKPIREAPGLETHKPLTLPVHRAVSHVYRTGVRSDTEQPAAALKAGESQMIELSEGANGGTGN